MKLQAIIYPYVQSKSANELYYRSKSKINLLSYDKLKIDGLEKVCFDTYFNAFSLESWNYYTNIQSLSINGSCTGPCIIQIFQRYKNTDGITDQLVCERHVKKSQTWKLIIPINQYKGICYLCVTPQSPGLILSNISFMGEISEGNNVSLAIVTCTYNREKEIKKNIQLIFQQIINSPSSVLYNKIKIFIIDNGRTLCNDDFPISESINLIPNSNTGGSGGFTRGLIEVLQQKQEYSFTHVLLMDDDIMIEPEALERTYSLLYALRKEYANAFIGGAMLRKDQNYIQEECGAIWSGKINSLGKGVDLRSSNVLLENCVPSKANYNAWWFCCMPLKMLDMSNLPLPFFIHGDDIEYGLRNCNGVILLNGICVWHDVFENKRNSILEYYDIRNYLIINSVYCNDYSIWKISFNLLKRFIANIFRMRYQDIHIGIQGIQDFLRGPQWWGKQDLVKLNNCLLSQALKYEPFKEIMHPAGKIKKSTQAFYLLTLNGAIFPKKKKVLCIPCGDSPYGLFRAKSAYLVDTNNKKAVHVKFSYKKCLIAYLEVLKALAQLILQYKSKRSDYINHLSDLGSWEYWKRYYQTPT